MVQYVNTNIYYGYYLIKVIHGTICKYRPLLLHNKSNLRYNMLHLLNKKASVSSYTLVGHVMSSQNECGLSKYIMVHEFLCSITD